MDKVNKNDILHGLRDIGICIGDALFFHSSMQSFGHVEGGVDAVIDATLDAVGNLGTVAVPTFVQRIGGALANYEQRRKAWDIARSPSDVGYVTEVFRLRPTAVRSDHCCVSLAAIGAEATVWMAGHDTAHGRPYFLDSAAMGIGSPWDWMTDRNVHYLHMGTTYETCSLFHYTQALWTQKHGMKEDGSAVFPVYDFQVVGAAVQEHIEIRKTNVGSSRWECFLSGDMARLTLEMLEQGAIAYEVMPIEM